MVRAGGQSVHELVEVRRSLEVASRSLPDDDADRDDDGEDRQDSADQADGSGAPAGRSGVIGRVVRGRLGAVRSRRFGPVAAERSRAELDLRVAEVNLQEREVCLAHIVRFERLTLNRGGGGVVGRTARDAENGEFLAFGR